MGFNYKKFLSVKKKSEQLSKKLEKFVVEITKLKRAMKGECSSNGESTYLFWDACL